MPPPLSTYFTLLLPIRKSSIWPINLRQTYVSLFGLDSINSKCNMASKQSSEQVIQNDEKDSDDPEDEDYVLNDDIEDASNYLNIMNSRIEDKEQNDHDAHSPDDIQMGILNPRFADDDTMNRNVNVSDNTENTLMNSDNRNVRPSPWNQVADDSHTSDAEIRPPPRKKRKISHNLCDIEINTVGGQTPTKANRNTLLVRDLRALHLKPHNQEVRGAKYVLVNRIIRHYNKEHNLEEEDFEDDEGDHSVIDRSLDQCVAQVDLDRKLCCGRIMDFLKVRNVHTNRHLTCCNFFFV
eukprot:793170_1